MGGQGVADGAAWTGHDLQGARRQARFLRQLAQTQGGERRLAGRLEHDGVSGGESRRDLPAGDGKRKVPGHDGGDDAHGLAEREVKSAAGHGNGLAEKLGDGSRVILEHPRPQADFGARIGQGLADILALHLRQRFQVFPDESGDVEQNVRSLTRDPIAPTMSKGALGALHRPANVGQARRRDLTENLLRRWVGLRNRFAFA